MNTGFTETTFTYTQKFQVAYEFKVCFCHSLFDVDDPLFANILNAVSSEAGRHDKHAGISKCVIVLDEGVAKTTPELLTRVSDYAERYRDQIDLMATLVIPGGEAAKNSPERLKQILSLLHENSMDRHSYLIAIGGGAILDLVGFAAALFHRGVRLVRVPTTVLSQNDAGVGVKNGINAFGTKNLMGTFAPPFAVLNDFTFLATLPPRDRIAGLSEALKVALIRDVNFFYWLEESAALLRSFDPNASSHMIRHCAQLHMEHIAQNGDPFEVGNSRPLDFGHWIAHRLETLSSFEIRHGEAVAMGIVIDNRYAVLMGMLSEKDELRVYHTLKKLGLPLHHPLLLVEQSLEDLLQGLEDFREHLGGELSITLLTALGQSCEVNHIEQETMSLAISQVGNSIHEGS
ncbi:MAG: 3-dehydroquinate synthase [Leptospirales bacterium]